MRGIRLPWTALRKCVKPQPLSGMPPSGRDLFVLRVRMATAERLEAPAAEEVIADRTARFLYLARR